MQAYRGLVAPLAESPVAPQQPGGPGLTAADAHFMAACAAAAADDATAEMQHLTACVQIRPRYGLALLRLAVRCLQRFAAGLGADCCSMAIELLQQAAAIPLPPAAPAPAAAAGEARSPGSAGGPPAAAAASASAGDSSDLLQALNCRVQPTALVMLAKLQEQAGDVASAVASYTRALSLDPADFSAWMVSHEGGRTRSWRGGSFSHAACAAFSCEFVTFYRRYSANSHPLPAASLLSPPSAPPAVPGPHPGGARPPRPGPRVLHEGR